MKTKDNIGLLGGYAAKTCPEVTRKDFSKEYDSSLKLAPTPLMQSMFDAGNRFEEEIIDELRELFAGDAGVRILDGVEDRSDKAALQAWADESMGLFQDPDVWFILNPRLNPVPELNLTGEPDAAIRDADGNWLPVDIKDHGEMSGTAKPVDYLVSELASPRKEDASNVAMKGKPQLQDSMQLAHYHRMFQAHGLTSTDPVRPVWGAIIGRSRSLVWRQIDKDTTRNKRIGDTVTILEHYDIEQEFRRAVRRRERERRLDLTIEPLVGPEWSNSECGECPWREVCHAELSEIDDISLLPGMTLARTGAYREAGVNTTAEVAQLDYQTAALTQEKLPVASIREMALKKSTPTELSLPAETLLKNRGAKLQRATALLHDNGFHTVADLQKLDATTAEVISGGSTTVAKSIDQARVQRDGRAFRARGVETIGFDRAGIEVDVDFEDHGGYTYMFGLLISERTPQDDGTCQSSSEYKAFCSWDESEEGEAKAFADFWNELMRLERLGTSQGVGFRSYYYTPHEVAAIKNLAKRHEGQPGVPTLNEVTTFMDSDSWVDLYPIVSKEAIWPTKNNTLKSIAPFCGHSWSGDGVNGALSIVWYQEAVRHEDLAVREDRQEKLLTYNHEDVVATKVIRDWLTEQSGTETSPGGKLLNVADLDEQYR